MPTRCKLMKKLNGLFQLNIPGLHFVFRRIMLAKARDLAADGETSHLGLIEEEFMKRMRAAEEI